MQQLGSLHVTFPHWNNHDVYAYVHVCVCKLVAYLIVTMTTGICRMKIKNSTTAITVRKMGRPLHPLSHLPSTAVALAGSASMAMVVLML